ncbi:hypothetical protein PACILC2_38690 [Paenibacillus cisolokensis]|uniref:Flagellar hook capping protein n=1 Tax=Paenibacillus cisolokensis TaxID=1658519 RepID=A0ABQ4NAQ1_9BACL|nr:flagellar hook capping FlgD N-terminal domain-containing protein [Paenibacillus cisolokensis]GIQ65301.1 hypothetical protein PACILC2_38690 [Paenibacillus cisolokensis]
MIPRLTQGGTEVTHMADNAIPTNNVWPYYNAANVARAGQNNAGGQLGKDEFLKILVAQLRHQDPMAPMQDTEFIGQMAQFTSLEQLMNMAEEISLLRQNLGANSNLIGKTVEWYELIDGSLETKKGVVDSILLRDGIQYVVAGATEVPIDELISISNTPDGGEQPEEPPEEADAGTGGEAGA